MEIVKKQRKAERNRKFFILALAFLIPTIILTTTYMLMQFYPAGDRSPLTIDLYHQYVSFLAELRRKLLSGENIFYSWSVGMGTNFYALTAYYAASPLNLFLVFFPLEHITEAVTFLTVTKIGLSGLAFAYMLYEGPAKRLGSATIRSRREVRLCKSDDKSTDIFIIILATAYALNGFNLTYSWDIMWLDVIALLPIIILGVNKAIRESKFTTYIVSLALALMINYYLAFFVCLFVACYFFVAYFTAKSQAQQLRSNLAYAKNGVIDEESLINPYEEEYSADNAAEYTKSTLEYKLLNIKFWPVFSKFALFTIIALAISAVMLLPTALSLIDTSAAGDAWPSDMRINFDAFDFMSRGLMNMSPAIRSGLPNIYVGILAFIFLPLYVFSNKIGNGEKISHLALLGFLYISFNNNFLDFFWHGMHYPNQLPYRYAFLFSFVMLLIMFRTLTVIREYSAKTLMLITAGAILFVVLAEKLDDSVSRENAFINILYFIVYLAMFAGFRKARNFRTASLLLGIIIISELIVNSFMTIYTIGEDEVYTRRSSFVDDMHDVGQLIDVAKEQENGDFFRMEVKPQKTTNDGALYGYPGITLFSSTSREATAKMMKKLAFHGNNINSYKYVDSTNVGNSLLGMKYLLLKNGASRDTSLEKVDEYNDMTLLKNPHALELGAAAGPELKFWNPTEGSPFSNWNSLLEALGEQGLFKHVDPEVVNGYNFGPASGSGESGVSVTPEDFNASGLMNFKIDVKEDQFLYLAIETSKDMRVKIRVNETTKDEEVKKGKPGTVRQAETRNIHWIETFDVGYVAAGDEVNFSIEQDKDKASAVTVYAATVDKADYERTMSRLKEREVDVQEWNSNSVIAKYNAKTEGNLFLNIPYDSSWKAYIDGEEVQTESIAETALLSVPTEAGEHELKLVFIPRGFEIGLTMSIGGLILLLVLCLIRRLYTVRKDKERISNYIMLKNNFYTDYREAYNIVNSVNTESAEANVLVDGYEEVGVIKGEGLAIDHELKEAQDILAVAEALNKARNYENENYKLRIADSNEAYYNLEYKALREREINSVLKGVNHYLKDQASEFDELDAKTETAAIVRQAPELSEDLQAESVGEAEEIETTEQVEAVEKTETTEEKVDAHDVVVAEDKAADHVAENDADNDSSGADDSQWKKSDEEK